MKKFALFVLCLMMTACADLNGFARNGANVLIVPEANDSRMVVLNTNTHVYHDPKCKMAKTCTKNCQMTTKYYAKSSGATPCQKCSGGNK